MWAMALRFVLAHWLTLAKYGAIAGALWWLYNLGDTTGFERARNADSLVTYRDNFARARTTDDARWETYIADTHEILTGISRTLALMDGMLGAAQLTAGLADRVHDYEVRAGAVSCAGAGNGATGAGAASAQGLERLRELQQRVYDTAGQCGAALDALGAKPICECPRASAGPDSRADD